MTRATPALTYSIDDVPRGKVIAAIILSIGGFVLILRLFGAMLSLSTAMFLWREAAITAFALSMICYVMLVERLPLLSLGLRRPTSGTLSFGLLCFLAHMIVAGGAMTIIRVTHTTDSASTLRLLANQPVWALVTVAMVAGVTEEVIFRGILIDHFTTLAGKRWLGAALSIAVFTLMHLNGWAPIHLVFVAPAATVMTLFYLWKRDLVMCMFAHVLTDIAGLLASAAQANAHA